MLEKCKTPTSGIQPIPENLLEVNELPLSPILTKRKSLFNNTSSRNKKTKVNAITIPTEQSDTDGLSKQFRFTDNSPLRSINKSLTEKVVDEIEKYDSLLSPALGQDISNKTILLRNLQPSSPILCRPIEEKKVSVNSSNFPLAMQQELQSSFRVENQAVSNFLDLSNCNTPTKSDCGQCSELQSQVNSPVLGCSMLEKPGINVNKESAGVMNQDSPVLSSKCKTNILFNKKKKFRLNNLSSNFDQMEPSLITDSNQVLEFKANLDPNQIKMGIEKVVYNNQSNSLTESKNKLSPTKQKECSSPLLHLKNTNKSTEIKDALQLLGTDILCYPVFGKYPFDMHVYFDRNLLPEMEVSPTDVSPLPTKVRVPIRFSPDESSNFKNTIDKPTPHPCSQDLCTLLKKGPMLACDESKAKKELLKNQYFDKDTPINSPSFNSELELSKFPLNFLEIGDMISSPWESLAKKHKLNQETEVVPDKLINQSVYQESRKESKPGTRCFSSLELEQINVLDINKNQSRVFSNNSCFQRSESQEPQRNNNVSKKVKKTLFNFESESLFEPQTVSNFREEIQSKSVKHFLNQKLELKHSKLKTAKKNLNVIYNSMSENRSVTGLKCKNRNTSYNQGKSALEEEMGSYLLLNAETLPPLALNNNEMSKFSDFHTPKAFESMKMCSAKGSKMKNKASKIGFSKYKLKKNSSLWKNPGEFLTNDNELKIEEFEDENPLAIAEVESLSANKLVVEELHEITVEPTQQTVKNYLINSINKESKADKSLVANVSSLHNNVEACLEEAVIERDTDGSSDESEAEAEADIQMEATQESVISAEVQIDCSTSPNTKSTQDSQHECSGKLSFPPALKSKAENKANKDSLLDSVSKSKRTKSKRDSLVGRLRRLVRAERAEVNMFHHEDVNRSAKMCSLTVHSVSKVCSRYQLVCSYTDFSSYCSEQLSAGEEVLDPEVQVFVDPNYLKDISAGCTIWIYPPWSSCWVDGKDLMMMYCVSKIRVIGPAQVPLMRPQLPKTTVQHQFTCNSLDQNCGCSKELMSQLFGHRDSSDEKSVAELSIMSAFASGCYPYNVTLKLTFFHRFQARRKQDGKVLPSVLCVDGNGYLCQFNMKTDSDTTRIDSVLNNAKAKTIIMDKLVIYKRIIIDRCKGLRTMLTHLTANSVTQQLMYVLTPSSDEWSVKILPDLSPTSHAVPLLSFTECQDKDGRGEGEVQVLSQRGNKLYVYEKVSDSFFKMIISPGTVFPDFAPRAFLHIQYCAASSGDLVLDKYTSVSVMESNGEQMLINIPSLSADSSEGDLVLLDGVVTKVNSEMIVRWVGSCGHKLLKLQETRLFYCVDCRLTVTSCLQQFELEVCVVASSVHAPIRVKVKSETAQSLLVGKDGEITPGKKSYNMISAIGGPLKCTAVVLEVLKNPFEDILEFLLEEI